jgi:hypothetical protein
LLMALGELHGRNLTSALMWGRVHNRTRDRGGKPIRLAWPWASPPDHPEDRGRFAYLPSVNTGFVIVTTDPDSLWARRTAVLAQASAAGTTLSLPRTPLTNLAAHQVA